MKEQPLSLGTSSTPVSEKVALHHPTWEVHHCPYLQVRKQAWKVVDDMLEVTQNAPGYFLFLEPTLQERSLGFENQGL